MKFTLCLNPCQVNFFKGLFAMCTSTHFSLILVSSIVHFVLIFRRKFFSVFEILAPRAGFEPATLCLEGRCSIQLSYRGTSSVIPLSLSTFIAKAVLRGLVFCATPIGLISFTRYRGPDLKSKIILSYLML